MTLLGNLRETAARRPADRVLHLGDRHATYGDLERGSNSAARVLRALGVRRGDRVCLYSTTSIEFIWAYLGCLKLGAVVVPLNPTLRSHELSRILSDSEPRVLVGDAEQLEFAATCAPGSLQALLGIGQGSRTPPATARAENGPGIHSFLDAMREASALPLDEVALERELALILYTSGTTGESRGAMLTHGNLAANIRALVRAFQWTPEDRLVHALPLFHVHGLCVGLHGAILTGCEITMLPRFDAEEVLRTLVSARATLFMGVPTMYSRMLAAADGKAVDLCGMRLFVSGSAPLPDVVLTRFEERFGHTILQRYGMTESLITVAQTPNPPAAPGKVGFPVLGVELRLVDEDWADVPDGQEGQILVRGSSVGPGYWRNEQATQAAFRDGWLLTGDIGKRDPSSGELEVVGRLKEIIITGGHNVHPREVEEVLCWHPDVREAAVFGVADSDLGERIVAALVLEKGAVLDEEAIRAHCVEKLAPFKKPRTILALESLPRNAMGKVTKADLASLPAFDPGRSP
ncbi:MAG: AMP-binding protein [Planctomycetota bacterium]